MSVYQKFAHHSAGSTAIVFSLALLPLFGLAGAALDYSRAAELKSRMSVAADAAALAAARQRTATPAERQKIAKEVFMANMKGYDLGSLSLKVVDIQSGVRVTADIDQANKILSVIGKKDTHIKALAEAKINEELSEVALVLDVTGSMKNDMGTLKSASREFVELVIGGASNPNVRMSIVPFSASVNVGTQNLPMNMMDTGANSLHHASALEDRHIADMSRCNPDPYASSYTGSVSYGAPPPPPTGPRGSDKGASLRNVWQNFAALAHGLYGISSAKADVTPNTQTPTTAGYSYAPGAPFADASVNAWVPNGFPLDGTCGLKNPNKISHFDLFRRIQGGRWKGCVEARPEPYDVSDIPPHLGIADTLFVPYFWPDEAGDAGKSGYANSYIADKGALPIGWNMSGDMGQFANLFKYNAATSATIKETGPYTSGPNAGCPDELLRLTNKKVELTNKIDSLSHWFGGGTIVSEGVMWGWRTLSPNAPFADGASYKKAKKFMVLMSDGANTIEANNLYGPTISDYSAYGYIRNGRFGSENYPDVENYLDKRQNVACANVKNTGIRVYTVLFRDVTPSAIDGMRGCASDPKMFKQAKNSNELQQAFQEIAGEINRLRITR
jgi:Flp pilus assembly protein TadG